MNPYQYKARIVRVIDGDTVEADIDLGFYMTCRIPVRLAHINAKEHNEVGGKQATDHLKKLIGDGNVIMQTFKPHDKYGRYLAVLYRNAADLNEQMITDGFAVSYEGGER